MSCNENNNNHNESTNKLKDLPKIICSDHSTNQIKIQGERIKKFSDKEKVIDDKNCLAVPMGNFYSSEARPP